MRTFRFFSAIIFSAACLSGICGEGPVFQQDFEKAEAGKDAGSLDFLVMGDGEFKVKQLEGNKVLELSPTPLETYGLLFGPTETEDITVQARAFGTSSGRRFPVFAVGLNGVGGFMLRVNPAKKQLELLKSEDVKASAPLVWASGTWTQMQFNVTKVKDGQWKVQGKAWEHGKEVPKDWQVTFEDTEKPLAGRATLWGIPYSAQAIQFDDLVVKKK
jgi:hypothetical protein